MEFVREQKENEISVEQYKSVLKFFSVLIHETPDLLDGSFDKDTLSKFLKHIGMQVLKDKNHIKAEVDLFLSMSLSFIDLPNEKIGRSLERKFQADLGLILAQYHDITTKKYPFGRTC